jgi:hypothetical protein
VVSLRVTTIPPSVLPTSLGRHVAFGRIERTFRFRVEELR